MHTFYINYFSVRVINPWNSLLDYIKESKSLNIFKNSYDEHVKNVENIHCEKKSSAESLFNYQKWYLSETKAI